MIHLTVLVDDLFTNSLQISDITDEVILMLFTKDLDSKTGR